jgi:hypothetical protein
VTLREGDAVQIDGRAYGNGRYRIRPGSHKAVVLKAGVVMAEGVIDVSAAHGCILSDVPRVHCAH